MSIITFQIRRNDSVQGLKIFCANAFTVGGASMSLILHILSEFNPRRCVW